MPMFNEEENIAGAIRQAHSLAPSLTDDYEIIIVDDASTDRSAEIVGDISLRDPTVKLFRMDKNTKFGGAFAKGFKSASKDVIVYMDSDMPVSVEDIKASFPLISEAEIVTGYSRIRKGDTPLRKTISGVYNLMVKVLFGLDVRDVNSGYKVVSRKLVDGMNFISRSPFIDVELFLRAKRKKSRVIQYPLIFRMRSGGRSYIASFPIILATFRDMLKVKVFSLFST
jgi:glycosyltransferase involved in cell wall biosynthesis